MAEQVMDEQKSADGASSFRITYYAFGGRGEPIKLAATLAGVSFESKIISNWAPIKAAGSAVWSGPPEVTLLDKNGNDVTTIAQSNACLRFVGSLVDGLYPADLLARAHIDGNLDSCEDMINAYMGYAFAPADAKKALAEKLCETYKYWFAKFETRLEENEKRGASNGFFVGNSMTIADLKSVSSFGVLSSVPGVADLFEKFARLNAWFNMMNEQKEVKAAQAIYQKNYDAFKADNKQNLFKHAGKAVFVGEAGAAAASATKRILMVCTNTASFVKKDEAKTEVKTGFYIPEIAHPWAIFSAAGYEMTYVSPLGGDSPCDPSSIEGFKDDAECKKFQAEVMGGKMTLATLKIEEVKDAAKFDMLFYVGGVGAAWDFPDAKVAASTAAAIYESGGFVGGVCHGSAGLINIVLSNGKALVEGKTVTGFTNEEEAASGLTETVPLLLETELKKKGARFTSVQNWGNNVEASDRLFTGQNPASATGVAKAIVEAWNGASEEKPQQAKLYGSPICPFAQRAWLTAEIKNVPYEYITCSLSDKSVGGLKEAYAQALGRDPNSDGKVPTLLTADGQYLTESSVVARYLDYAYSDEAKFGPSLFPTDAFERAAVEIMTAWFGDCGWIKSHYGTLMQCDPEKSKTMVEAWRANWKVLNEKLAQFGKEGLFLGGERVSFFDVMAYPFFERLCTIEHFVKLDIYGGWFDEFPRIKSWFATMQKNEGVKRTIQTREDLVKVYATYRARGQAVYDKELAEKKAAAEAK